MCSSWDAFFQGVLVLGMMVAIGIPTLMYLDGYWTEERINKRKGK